MNKNILEKKNCLITGTTGGLGKKELQSFLNWKAEQKIREIEWRIRKNQQK